VLLQRQLSLYPSIRNLTDFLAIKLGPLLAIKLFVKFRDAAAVTKVDERIANIALVLEVYWEVEKVVFASVLLVDDLEEGFLVVLVGDVADH
jgi:hypothetical protein